jgi:serine/threonine protein kinase
VKKPIPFGKYYLLDRISAGGMAEVFRAKAFGVEGFERIVAVKRILPSIAVNTDFITMFIDEAKIAVQLNHANIAQIFDLGKVGNAYFIALEYVHGKDLRAIFEAARALGTPVPVELACYVMMKTCEGLDYAHNKRDASGRDLELVHRDVSPQNILISFDGEPKLIDFGIARAAGKVGKTQAGALRGKFGYLSPEQLETSRVDRRSDVFGVGIVLHELLTGERLFAGEPDRSSIEKLRELEIPRPSTRNASVPAALEDIVMKALSRAVQDRYQTAMELHDDLQRFLYGRGEAFGRRELSAWLRQNFAAEAAFDQEAVGDLRDVEVVEASETTDVAPTLEPAEPIAVNRDAPNSGKKSSTMLGMPAVLPPGAGRSVPPPPPRSPSIAPRPPAQGRSAPPPPPRSAPPPTRSVAPPAPPTPPARVQTVPPAPPRAPSVPPGQLRAPQAPPSSGQIRVPTVPPGQQLAVTPVMPIPARPQSVPPGAMAAATIPSMNGRSPSLPPGAARSAPPPPPGQGYASSPPPAGNVGSGFAERGGQSSAVLSMDWDDEELSTQIYDRPEDQPGGAPYQSVDGGYEEVGQGGYSQSGVATFVPPVAQGGMPGVHVSPRAFAQSEPPSAEHGLHQAPMTSRAAQVTQPIVTHGGGVEKNRSLLYTGLGVGAVAVLCVLIYVFLAKTEPGVVQVTTHPVDAQVMFDGKPAGSSSPFVVTGVAPNENHLIEVKKQGYTSWSQQVQVQPGQTLQLPVGLEPASNLVGGQEMATGGFSLETLPPGARVFLDGQELGGVTPLRVGNLVPRRYDVKVRLAGYRETTIPVEVRSGIDQSLPQSVLEAQQMRVRVTSEPPNAEAVVSRGDERRPLGKTPVDVTLENNGTPWVLEVSKKGFEAHSETLSSQSGSNELAVRAVLMKGASEVAEARPVVRNAEPAMAPRPRAAQAGGGGGGGGSGTLRVNSRPWSQVFVDGKMIGNTPQQNLKLSAGDHRITLVNPEFRLRKNLTVTIKAGETTTEIVTLQ